MKIPIHIAQKLLQLLEGSTIPASMAKHSLIEELVSESIIERNGRIQKKLKLRNRLALFHYLQNKFGVTDLEKYIEISQKENVQRNELVAISSDSKLINVRTFKGFLINSYLPLAARIDDRAIVLNFSSGIFQFIFDYANFLPDPSVIIVGIENPENFRYIERQKHLFKDIQPLFVSRYPQNQSRDLIKWLQSISNKYLHFGDFDFAGIGIYINEYKKYLGDKASFFIPNDIERLIEKKGNAIRYNTQKINFSLENIQEKNLIELIGVIHKNKKGLDQEIFIKQ
ncbi:hypothetical protein Belba_2553 [Belliella baltica DSM 15883]|uniref:DUF7281 domain-containing protein n=1 Tax=Belliella baltica (strain DSM 15883 / CIP 108006 / LMG 21964 / BA134) TaxID=866536 RepID=I3Z787_BELBD|nr:hypothetical protein [Belliella baltica]AFL85105.1 hypothetical protein Belba_2553 [Belliella baltica DSM 15883]